MALNSFTYKYVAPSLFGYETGTFKWTVNINGTTLTGEASSIRQAFRRAKRSVRRYRKMWNFLNPNEPRI